MQAVGRVRLGNRGTYPQAYVPRQVYVRNARVIETLEPSAPLYTEDQPFVVSQRYHGMYAPTAPPESDEDDEMPPPPPPSSRGLQLTQAQRERQEREFASRPPDPMSSRLIAQQMMDEPDEVMHRLRVPTSMWHETDRFPRHWNPDIDMFMRSEPGESREDYIERWHHTRDYAPMPPDQRAYWRNTNVAPGITRRGHYIPLPRDVEYEEEHNRPELDDFYTPHIPRAWLADPEDE